MTNEELNALIAQAEGGDVAAMNQLGQIYGGNEFKDFEKAFYWHKKAAELGNVNSMSNLGGWCYLQGNGTEKNIPLADEWLKKCVENGGVWIWAFNEIANIYANDAQYKDLNKAFYWYSKSAEAGDALGMSNLGGWCYLWGNGTEKNLKLAMEWLEKAAEKDNVWSMYKLACDIYSQDNEFKDYDKAFAWFEKIVERSYALFENDYDRVRKCVEKIAEDGYPKAICLMPKMLPDPFGGEHPDKWKWIQKAAEVGDTQCQYKLAERILCNNDIETAFKWFVQSAKGGNADAISRLNSLGLDFQFGNNGRMQNQPLAYRFYVAAAECGNADAMANVANCYANGIGIDKDLNKAFEYYKQSAEQGNRLGMSNLGGWCYLWGNGVERDVDKAVYWLAKAADECGDIWSMNKLTYIYGELEGYTNNEQAAKWFLELIKRDCDPNSGVYEKTGYNKDLYEKVKNAILNSASEGDMSSLSGSSSGGSLLGGSISIVSTNAKSYISQAEEVLAKKEAAESEKIIPLIEKDYENSDENPFKNFTGTFIVPEGTKRIGEKAFYNCEGLTSITIPNSVNNIGPDAFYGCNGLTSPVYNTHLFAHLPTNFSGKYTIPDGIETISAAFRECSGLTSVTIGNSVTSIGSFAFYGCTGLKSVTIGNSVTTIGWYAFHNCTGLTSVTIPNSVTHIEDWAFHNCSNLTSIIIPDSVISIGGGAFDGCKSLAGIKLGKGVMNIGEYAFYDCHLSMIIIPKGTRQRFENMEGLKGHKDKIVEE